MSDLDFTKHWDAERTRKKQAALTRLANGLRKEVIDNPMASELFEPDEIAAMTLAATALGQAKHKFAHIKEKKARIEKRKSQELASITSQCKKHAKRILDALNPNPDTFTKEQFCLWITTAHFTRNRPMPEVWQLDINDNMDNHYLESDHALRRRHAWTMRSSAQQALEDCLRLAWEFSVEDDAWKVRVPIEKAVSEIKALMQHEEYTKVEKRYAHLIAPLEAYNREVEAIQRRKNIKSV